MALEPTEETVLLQRPTPKQTPLPWRQVSIVMLVQVCEPLASQSIYPYINQLISELGMTGGDEKKVGYYAGVIEGLFFLSEATTTLLWSRASDSVGRKPVLLLGLFGSTVSILCFGLSRTFSTLVISRCLCGFVNGNVGVLKSALGDMTDRTNRAEALVSLPIVWAIGASVGPLIGGSLARPHDRFPNAAFFGLPFWRSFPYFLPCLVVASVVFIAWLVVLSMFRETAPRKIRSPGSSWQELHPNKATLGADKPLPLISLLTPPVVVSVSNYVAIGFLNTSLAAIFPLFLAMPLELGGLGLAPPQIGAILAAWGITTGVFQVFLFARFIRWFGEKRTFVHGLATNLLIFLLFPATSILARMFGLGWAVYIPVGCILVLGGVMDTAFGAIFMFILASAPRSSRGTVNGLSQSSVAIARAIGPALGTSLFSMSVENNLLGGYFVYVLFFGFSCASMWLATKLPEEVWDDIE